MAVAFAECTLGSFWHVDVITAIATSNGSSACLFFFLSPLPLFFRCFVWVARAGLVDWYPTSEYAF